MEWILLVAESWWWVAPAAAGAGATTYAGVTARARRARRLELDAARHEEGQAHRALISARARVSEAQAAVLAARAVSAPTRTDSPPKSAAQIGAALLENALTATGLVVAPLTGSPELIETKRRLIEAKSREKSASYALKASRTRVKASSAHYHAASATEPLPIERVFADHDAVIARWMPYETDPTKAIEYPQLSDPAQPATLAFLRAQRAAQELRPASARERIAPQRYLDYRDAVRALAVAFDEAERQAGAAGRPSSQPPRPGFWPAPGWRPARPSA